jgi:hypothetical protein
MTQRRNFRLCHAHRQSFAVDENKPNILVIWGDDIGVNNLSCYGHLLMGYHTPNIKDFPPRQKPASFTIDDALAAMSAAGTGSSVAGSA